MLELCWVLTKVLMLVVGLLYVSTGTFAETTSPEQQLHLILDNAKLVRAVGGLGVIIDALVKASGVLDRLM